MKQTVYCFLPSDNLRLGRVGAEASMKNIGGQRSGLSAQGGRFHRLGSAQGTTCPYFPSYRPSHMSPCACAYSDSGELTTPYSMPRTYTENTGKVGQNGRPAVAGCVVQHPPVEPACPFTVQLCKAIQRIACPLPILSD